MQIDAFPGCCSARIIHHMTGHRVEEIRAELQAEKRRAANDMEGRAFIVAITNDEQESAIAALKAEGFRASRGTVGRHGKSCKLWYCNLKSEKGKLK